MMAQGVEDGEGDLRTRVRDLVGADVPFGAILDLHGNVSQQMVESGTIIIGCKEYPHAK
jgi:microcystin degradation protein MlrC